MYLDPPATTLQQYINDLRRHLSRYLLPGIGMRVEAFPAKDGALFEIRFGPSEKNDDHINSLSDAVTDALSKVKQQAFGGNLRGFRFGGTNVIVEGDRVVLIKGETEPKYWSDSAAKEDAMRLVNPTHAHQTPS